MSDEGGLRMNLLRESIEIHQQLKVVCSNYQPD